MISIQEVMARFEVWFLKQSEHLQEELLKFAYLNRPRKNVKLSQLFGFENTGAAFDLDLSSGQIIESELKDILSGQIEVKHDRMVSKTGNVAIEYFCRGKPSGINNTKAQWWALVLGNDYDVVVLVKTEKLKEIVKGCRSVNGGDNGVARMYLVPKGELLE